MNAICAHADSLTAPQVPGIDRLCRSITQALHGYHELQISNWELQIKELEMRAAMTSVANAPQFIICN